MMVNVAQYMMSGRKTQPKHARNGPRICAGINQHVVTSRQFVGAHEAQQLPRSHECLVLQRSPQVVCTKQHVTNLQETIGMHRGD